MNKRDWFRYYELKMEYKYKFKFDVFFSLLFIIGRFRLIVKYHTISKRVTDLTDNMAIIIDPLPSK